MTLLSIIREAHKYVVRWLGLEGASGRDWKEAGILHAFSFVGGLAPLWLGYFIASFRGPFPDLVEFTRHGEFALYGASMLAPTFYLLLHTRSQAPFPGKALYGLTALSLTFMSVAAYSVVAPSPTDTSATPVDGVWYAQVTIAVFLLSAAVCFFVTVQDMARSQVDIPAIVRANDKALADDFDALEGK